MMEPILLEVVPSHVEDRKMIWYSQHGLTKKIILINLVAFCDSVTASTDKTRATNAIYLNFCKDFEVVPHNILDATLERDVFDGWNVEWIRN